MNRFFLAFLLLPTLFSCKENSSDRDEPGQVSGKVTLWITTGDQTKLLARDTSVNLVQKQQNNQGVTITLEEEETLQEMEGFGAALTESSAYLMHTKLSAAQRKELIRELFSRDTGIGISYLRITMGASDFSLEDFTYNDRPVGETDPALEHFSIAKDQRHLLPVLKEILEAAPRIRIMATPWSAPAWMKTNGKLAGGKLKPEHYPAFALYFVKYLEAFKKEGIEIDAISVQNEPLHEATYPSMRMEAAEQLDFIKNHLGPLLEKENIKTKILAYDHNWDRPDYPMTILADPDARKYVSGSAFHAYAGNVTAMTTVHEAFKDKGLYFTEISGGQWATNFADNLGWNMKNIFIGAPANWSKNALLWNLALDENHGPTNKGCADCRGVITISEGGFIHRNVEYYAIAHLSKFVEDGAKRIKTNPVTAVEQAAFKNPDGTVAVVILNDANNFQKVNIVRGNAQVTFNQEPRSVITYVLE